MKTMLNIKTEKSLKDEAQKTAKNLGLPLSIIMNQYLKEFVSEKRITFSTHPTPNEKTQKILNQTLKDIGEKNLVGPFKTAEAMMKSLNS